MQTCINRNANICSHVMLRALPEHWPGVAFSTVPDLSVAEMLATQIRRLAAPGISDDAPLSSLDRLLTYGDFAMTDFGRSRGRIEAQLRPLPGDRFEISVAPSPPLAVAPGCDLRALDRRRWRFRVAHEIAHSFFYVRRAGARPARTMAASPAEERWCDEFARALLLPAAALRACPLDAQAIVTMHERHDVSLEVAVRGMARVHRRFLALLVERGRHAPRLRVQWHPEEPAVPARWWADPSLQSVHHTTSARDGQKTVRWGSRERELRWHALADRRQVLVII